MPESPLVAIFSDLHLPVQNEDRSKKLFAKALEHLRQKKITHLWLLGDIFDLLIGPFDFWFDVHQDIFNELRALKRQGCEILWLEGNHDFHISKLCRELKIDLRDGEQTFQFGEKKYFLAHGDLVNTEDLAYHQWRQRTRAKWFRSLISLAPNWFAKKYLLPFAVGKSQQSRRQSYTVSEPELKELYRRFASAKFKEGFSGVFMGHCHVSDLYNEGNFFYLNMGSWLPHPNNPQQRTFSFALWSPLSQSKIEIVELR